MQKRARTDRSSSRFPERLKKSILQAAIQGKLTEQNPNDEPAVELIKRIQVEKERLILEKKSKNRSNILKSLFVIIPIMRLLMV
nr:hypothetical protein [Canicola haemoglobinophilus]